MARPRELNEALVHVIRALVWHTESPVTIQRACDLVAEWYGVRLNPKSVTSRLRREGFSAREVAAEIRRYWRRNRKRA